MSKNDAFAYNLGEDSMEYDRHSIEKQEGDNSSEYDDWSEEEWDSYFSKKKSRVRRQNRIGNDKYYKETDEW